MTIGVYRLYVGSGWTHPDAIGRLTRVLDQLPGFLYRIDTLPPPDDAAETPEMLRARVRIALTQAHIAILHPEALRHADLQVQAEVDLARTGFRRRIPILGVMDAAETTQDATDKTQLDRLSVLEPNHIAAAIQELAEQAVAERRRLTDGLLAASPAAVAHAGERETAHLHRRASDGQRPLPVTEIIKALSQLQQARASRD